MTNGGGNVVYSTLKRKLQLNNCIIDGLHFYYATKIE